MHAWPLVMNLYKIFQIHKLSKRTVGRSRRLKPNLRRYLGPTSITGYRSRGWGSAKCRRFRLNAVFREYKYRACNGTRKKQCVGTYGSDIFSVIIIEKHLRKFVWLIYGSNHSKNMIYKVYTRSNISEKCYEWLFVTFKLQIFGGRFCWEFIRQFDSFLLFKSIWSGKYCRNCWIKWNHRRPRADSRNWNCQFTGYGPNFIRNSK